MDYSFLAWSHNSVWVSRKEPVDLKSLVTDVSAMLDSANALSKMPWACSSWKIPGTVQLDNCVFLHYPAVFLDCQFGHLTPLLLRLWQVSNGCQMKPSATALAPNIEVADHNADNVNLFTLVRLLDFLFDSLLLKRSCCYGQLIQSVDARCI